MCHAFYTVGPVIILLQYIPRVVVEKYVSLCSTCSLRKPQHTKALLRPIIADGLFFPRVNHYACFLDVRNVIHTCRLI